jgi:hypothetical protein
LGVKVHETQFTDLQLGSRIDDRRLQYKDLLQH